MALYYNEAWLAPEVNGPGIGVVDALAKDYRYRACTAAARRRRSAHGSARAAAGLADGSADEAADGADVREALKRRHARAAGSATGREFTTYVEDPKNAAKHGAQKGAHDDLAMAFMGAHRVAAELRPRPAVLPGGGARVSEACRRVRAGACARSTRQAPRARMPVFDEENWDPEVASTCGRSVAADARGGPARGQAERAGRVLGDPSAAPGGMIPPEPVHEARVPRWQ
jgi:hypothetical protein